jgi:hypothetical protein
MDGEIQVVDGVPAAGEDLTAALVAAARVVWSIDTAAGSKLRRAEHE